MYQSTRAKTILKMSNMFVLFCVLLIQSGLTFAATYYVSNSGNNGNTGRSQSVPWLTLGYSCSRLVAGDTLLIMGGTWRENNLGCDHSGTHDLVTLFTRTNGTAGHPIVFKAFGSRPRIMSYGSDYANYGIAPNANSYQVFDSLIIKKTYRGITFWDANDHITIKNCVIDSTGNCGANNNNGAIITLGVPAVKSYITVDACTLSNAWEAPGYNGDGNTAAILLYATTHSTFTNNVIWGIPSLSHGAVYLKGSSNDYNEVAYNTIYNVGGAGVMIYYQARYNTIHHNVIYNAEDGVCVESQHGSPEPHNTGNQVYNNTIYNCSALGIYMQSVGDETTGHPDSTQFWNNIVSTTQYGISKNAQCAATNTYSNYNCYYGQTSNTASWNGTSYTLPNFIANIHLDSNSIVANPLFVNASGHDFHLQAGSPAATGGRGGAYLPYMGAKAPAATGPYISLSSSSVAFSGIRNGTVPTTQTFTITNSGTGTLNWSVAADSSWLVAPSPSTGNSNSQAITVGVNTTNLSYGVHTAHYRITSTNATNSPQTITVTYTLPQPHLSDSPTSLTFSAVRNGTTPASQTFTITNSIANSGTLNWSLTKTKNWLSISPTSGNSNSQAITVSVIATDSAVGTHYDTISVSSTNADNSSQRVLVKIGRAHV
jgi:hypothetical protein